jgi:hypothetical protein
MVCKKCNEDLEIAEFSKDRSRKSGFHPYCKKCNSSAMSNWLSRNKEHISNYHKALYAANPDKFKKESFDRRRTLKGKETYNKSIKKYRASGKLAAYERKKKIEDPEYKLLHVLRNKLLHIVKKQGVAKSNRAIILTGCSKQELKQHLESQFQPGMSWDNYGKGGWVIDHIKPCAAFDFTDPKQQEECFHYTNLQPMWEIENMKKNSYFEGKKHYHKQTTKINKV